MGEVWKEVTYRGKSYKGYYEVSNLGRIRSVDRYIRCKNNIGRFIKGCIIVGSYDKDGYHTALIQKNGKRINAKVHRLVLEAFTDNLEGKKEVNHINGVKRDNRRINLEWSTSSENTAHAWATGLQPSQDGADNPNVKLLESDIYNIRELRKEGATLSSIAELVGTSVSNVKNVVYGYTWEWLK